MHSHPLVVCVDGGFAPLHLAAGQGHTEAVKALVSRKAVDKDIRTGTHT